VRKVQKRGFTIIEMLLSISIIALLSSLSFPFYRAFLLRNDLDIATNTVVQTARRAQSMSINGEDDSAWGISFVSGKVVLYKGNSYASRDTSRDEIYSVSDGVLFSGQNDVNYSKLYGKPSVTGSIVLTSNDTRTVTINEKGIFSY
jgi:prepilin-type N-terminal cleavage/methylation domain-containing protein